MPTFLCQLENNATFPVRVVVASQFNTVHIKIGAQDSIFTQFQPGLKAMVVFQDNTKELLDTFVISVTRRSRFKVLRLVFEQIIDENGNQTEKAVVIPREFMTDEGEELSPDEDGGPDAGTPL